MDEIKQHVTSSALSRARLSLYQRLMPKASVRVQLLLAAGLWLVAAGLLGVRGALWIGAADRALGWFLVSIAIGIALSVLVFDGVARRAVERIRHRGCTACAGGFFSLKSWALVLLMVAGGHALRLTDIPVLALGVLYLALGTALVMGDRIYWSEAIEAG